MTDFLSEAHLTLFAHLQARRRGANVVVHANTLFLAVVDAVDGAERGPVRRPLKEILDAPPQPTPNARTVLRACGWIAPRLLAPCGPLERGDVVAVPAARGSAELEELATVIRVTSGRVPLHFVRGLRGAEWRTERRRGPLAVVVVRETQVVVVARSAVWRPLPAADVLARQAVGHAMRR